MTVGYTFQVTCPVDGAPAEHVATGTSNGRAARAVARCTECRLQLLLEVTLTFDGRRDRPTRSDRTRAWRKANPEKLAAQKRRYYERRRAGVVF